MTGTHSLALSKWKERLTSHGSEGFLLEQSAGEVPHTQEKSPEFRFRNYTNSIYVPQIVVKKPFQFGA